MSSEKQSPSASTEDTSSPSTSKVSSSRRASKRSTPNGSPAQEQEKKFCRVDSWGIDNKRKVKDAFSKTMKEKLVYIKNNEDEIIDTIAAKMKKKCKSSCNRTEGDIKRFLLYYLKEIQRHRWRHDKPIDKWAELCEAMSPETKDLELQLKTAITVATEEPIPTYPKPGKKTKNSEPGTSKSKKPSMPEPDYNAVYKYLSCAVAGMPLPELSPIDSLLVEDCMQSLAEQIKTLDDGDLRLSLRRAFIYLTKTPDHTTEDEGEEETVKQLRKGTLYNPLGINENLIMPVPPS